MGFTGKMLKKWFLKNIDRFAIAAGGVLNKQTDFDLIKFEYDCTRIRGSWSAISLGGFIEAFCFLRLDL